MNAPDILRPTYELFVDGSPGPKIKPGFSGWGMALMAGDTPVFQACGTTKERCSSQAIELEALIQGLAYVHRAVTEPINIWTDSSYTANSVSRVAAYDGSGWLNEKMKPIPNSDRLQLIWEYLFPLDLLHRVTVRWIKGHTGKSVGNDLADKLSKQASGKGANWYGGADQAG